MGFVVNYPPATNVTVNDDGTQVVVVPGDAAAVQADNAKDAALAAQASAQASASSAASSASAASASQSSASGSATSASNSAAAAAVSQSAAAASASSAATSAASIDSYASLPVEFRQFAADGSVLSNLPARVHPAEQLLKQAVWWIDSAHSSADGQSVSNLGWGGSALDAQLGSAAGADSNDPKFLPWEGENYVYLPGVSGNSISVTAPAATDDYLATDIDGATTAGTASAGTFTFSTAGSWSTVVLRDASDDPLVVIDTSLIASGSQTSFTALTGQTVTINRSSSGRKSVAVTHPVWLFGTDDYMEVADNALLDFGASDDFTVLAVVRQWATPVNTRPWISKGHAGAGGFWSLNNRGLSAVAGGLVNDGTDSGDSQQSFTFGDLISAVFVLDRSANTVTTLVDGIAGTPVTTTAVGSVANSDPVLIGAREDNTYQDFEFIAAAVFRRALTSGEITTLSNYFAGRVA